MVFGYIDGGAGDGLALNRNIQSFKKLLLQPKTLINVKNRSFSKRINDPKVLSFKNFHKWSETI